MGRVRAACVGAAAAALLVLLAGCSPVPLRTHVERMTGFEGVIFVDTATGNDSNRGIDGEPLATISAALAKAQAYVTDGLAASAEVHVAEGTYEVDDSKGTAIEMKEGISLFGGYSSDFTVHDPVAHPTIIKDLSTTGEDTAAVRIYNGVTSATTIDGFTIIGGGGTSSTALDVEESSPTITNNTIIGGTGTDLTITLDVYDNAMPRVAGNTIVGGASPGSNFSLAINKGSNPIVTGNTISGGAAGSDCYGIFTWNTQATITDNIISGGGGKNSRGMRIWTDSLITVRGNSIAGGTGAEQSVGIDVQSDKVTIERNTISGGSGASERTIGVLCGAGADAVIRNNLIHGGTPVQSGTSSGVAFEGGGGDLLNNTVAGGPAEHSRAVAVKNGSAPQIVNNVLFTLGSGTDHVVLFEDPTNGKSAGQVLNNDFWDTDGSTLLYSTYDAQYSDDAAPINDLGWASGNIAVAPALADLGGSDTAPETLSDNNWRPSSTAPVEVRQGGMDGTNLGWGYTDDRDGVGRTDLVVGPNDNPANTDAGGWSMGAYEVD